LDTKEKNMQRKQDNKHNTNTQKCPTERERERAAQKNLDSQRTRPVWNGVHGGYRKNGSERSPKSRHTDFFSTGYSDKHLYEIMTEARNKHTLECEKASNVYLPAPANIIKLKKQTGDTNFIKPWYAPMPLSPTPPNGSSG
jgi:hypothetical protein